MNLSLSRTTIFPKVKGIVTHGRGQGEALGFKTANLSVSKEEIPVEDGVYAAYVKVDDRRFKAAVSVGASPFFESKTTSNIECHIIDFDEDIYNKSIEIEFVKFLRPMIKFSSQEELVKTVKKNIEEVIEIL